MLGDLRPFPEQGRGEGEGTNYRAYEMSQFVTQCFHLYGSVAQGSSSDFSFISSEALGELVLPKVFRHVPFVGLYHQTMVGVVREGTCRIKNQPCGHSSMYIQCI